jgi:hypothetical protein
MNDPKYDLEERLLEYSASFNPFFPRPPVRTPALATAFTRKAIS